MRWAPLSLLLLLVAADLVTASRDPHGHVGLVGCHVGAPPPGPTTTDWCSGNGGRFSVPGPVEGPILGAVFEVRWTGPPQATAPQLFLGFPRVLRPQFLHFESSGRNQSGSSVAGESPLVVRMSATQPDYQPHYPLWNHTAFRPTFFVGVSGGVAVERPFIFAATWFVNESAPPGYSYFAENPPNDPAPDGQDEVPVQKAEGTVVPQPRRAPAIGAYALGAAGLLLATPVLWWPPARRIAAAAGAFFTRLDRDGAATHPRRQALEALILAHPGIGYEEARRQLEWAPGSFEYHVRVLVRHGLIDSKSIGDRRWLYPAGAGTAATRPGPQTTAERVLKAVEANPGLVRGEASRILGMDPRALGYHLSWLARRGLLERRPDGRAVRYFPKAGARD